MNIRITMEIPVEMLTELQALLTGNLPSIHDLEKEPEPIAAPSSAHTEPAAAGDAGETEKNAPDIADIPVTKTMIRAKGLELTQAGKKAELEEVFKKFGAAKLRDLKEEDYAEAYRLLGEI